MKQGAEDHGKFKILARLLKIPLPYANGIMERLWLKAGQYRPDGAVGRWSNVEIAEYCGMPIEFDPDALVAAMIESRFLDREDGPTRLLVHDWPEHCTHFIHNKLARKSAYFANGSPPSLKRLDHRYKAEAELFYGVSAQSDKVSAQSNKARKQTDVGVSAQKGKMSAQSTPNARARPTPTPKPTPKPTPGVATPLVAADSFLQQQQHCPANSVVVADALRVYGDISASSIRRFIASCQNGVGYSESEIAGLIARIGPTLGRRVKNPIGVLISQVPDALPAYVSALRAAPEDPKCWKCGGSLSGAAINGACGECFEKFERGQKCKPS